MSQPVKWRITGRGGTGERNYRVGLEQDCWVSSAVQMAGHRGAAEDAYSSLFFLENGEELFEEFGTGRNVVSLRRFFIEQNSFLLTQKRQNFTIT